MMRLGVNVDHVATLREARKTYEPDPVAAAIAVEMAGADQVTIHLREDRRHIQNRDARLIREVVHTAMNLDMQKKARDQDEPTARPSPNPYVARLQERISAMNFVAEGTLVHILITMGSFALICLVSYAYFI